MKRFLRKKKGIRMNRKTETQRLYVYCHVCGNQLFRSSASDVEIRCSRCKSNLDVEITGSRVMILKKYAEAQMVAEPAAAYGNR